MPTSSVREWWLVAAPVMGMCAAGGVHLMACRARSGQRVVATLLIGAIAGAVVMLALSWWAIRDGGWADWPNKLARITVNCISYNAMFYLYAALFIALYSSVRLAVLHAIADSPVPLDHTGFHALMDPKLIATERLTRLLTDGRLLCLDERYFSRPDWLLALSRIYSRWREVVIGLPYLADLPSTSEDAGKPKSGAMLR